MDFASAKIKLVVADLFLEIGPTIWHTYRKNMGKLQADKDKGKTV